MLDENGQNVPTRIDGKINPKYVALWRKSNLEKSKKYSQKWRTQNREKDLKNKKEYRTNNKEKLALGYRKHTLKKEFGLSLEQYNEMLASQNGVCKICKDVCSTGKSLAVDHCHLTGKNRGLLCRDCNVTLGLMKDSPERLRWAADYLETANAF